MNDERNKATGSESASRWIMKCFSAQNHLFWIYVNIPTEGACFPCDRALVGVVCAVCGRAAFGTFCRWMTSKKKTTFGGGPMWRTTIKLYEKKAERNVTDINSLYVGWYLLDSFPLVMFHAMPECFSFFPLKAFLKSLNEIRKSVPFHCRHSYFRLIACLQMIGFRVHT